VRFESEALIQAHGIQIRGRDVQPRHAPRGAVLLNKMPDRGRRQTAAAKRRMGADGADLAMLSA